MNTFLVAAIVVLFYLIFVLGMSIISFSKNYIRIPVVIGCSILSIIYLTYNKISGLEISYFDFYSLSSSISMFKEAVITYKITIINVSLLHIPFIISFFLFPKIVINTKRCVLGLLLILIEIILVSGVVYYKKTGYGAQGLPTSLIMPAYYIDMYLDGKFTNDIHARQYSFESSASGKFKNIVLIIDESIRYDFIDINKDTGTTPYLNTMYNLLNFGKVSSYSNCSQYSNILIRKMARYKHETSDVKSGPYIWEIMNLAGYNNILIDAQNNGQGHDFFTEEELKRGNVRIIEAKSKKDDVEVAKLVNDQINNNNKNFILVMKKGAHFPYDNIGIEKKFVPNMETSNMRNESSEKIINSYKNLVYHNTNLFFKSLDVNEENTIFIYTSDHGQNFEKLNERLTHCSTIEPTKTEGEVPLFIFGQFKEDNFNSLTKQILHRGKNSHYDIPFFLMDFAGYSDTDIENLMGTPVPVDSFVYGNVYGFFGGSPERENISQ